MKERVSQFTKFILKKIIRGVAISDTSALTSTNIYKFHKISLNDKTIQEIVEEGRHYKLSPDQCIAEIRLADEKVNINPSIIRTGSYVIMETFKLGERIDLVFDNEKVGPVGISVLVGEHDSLMVLRSDITDVGYRDILRPMHRRLNAGFTCYFDVWRGDHHLTGDDMLFCPGVLRHIDHHKPGLVFSILDSDSTFVYTGEVEAKSKSYGDKFGNEFFVLFPSQSNPSVWRNDELKKFLDSEEGFSCQPFIIKVLDKTNALLISNPRFRFNKLKKIRTYEINQFTLIGGLWGVPSTECQLTTTVPGKLKYKQNMGGWELESRPEFVCNPLPDMKILSVIEEIFLKKKLLVISVDNIDSNLLDMGISIPDKMELLLEIESAAKVSLSIDNPDRIRTVRDVYDLLVNAKKSKNGSKK